MKGRKKTYFNYMPSSNPRNMENKEVKKFETVDSLNPSLEQIEISIKCTMPWNRNFWDAGDVVVG